LLKTWTLVYIRIGCHLKETESFLDLASSEIVQPVEVEKKNKEERCSRFERRNLSKIWTKKKKKEKKDFNTL